MPTCLLCRATSLFGVGRGLCGWPVGRAKLCQAHNHGVLLGQVQLFADSSCPLHIHQAILALPRTLVWMQPCTHALGDPLRGRQAPVEGCLAARPPCRGCIRQASHFCCHRRAECSWLCVVHGVCVCLKAAAASRGCCRVHMCQLFGRNRVVPVVRGALHDPKNSFRCGASQAEPVLDAQEGTPR